MGEAAKDLFSCLKVVYLRHESYELVKDGVADAELGAEDRRTLASAVRSGRKLLKPLKNPWA